MDAHENEPGWLFRDVENCRAPFIHLGGAEWTWSTRIGAPFKFWLVLNGIGGIDVNGTRFPLRPGTGFIFAPGDTVRAKSESDEPFRNMAFDFSAGPQAAAWLAGPGANRMGVPVARLGLYDHLLRYCLSLAPDDPEDRGLRHDLSVQMLAMFHRDAGMPPSDPVDRLLRRQMDGIIQNPGRTSTVDELAREAGLSRSQYNRRFRRIARESPKQFILRHRTDQAMQMLRYGSDPVSIIADALGYSDVFFFSRQFKRKTGLSPQRFRQRSTHE